MSEWLLVPLILGAGALFMVTACEVSARLGARVFRDEGEEFHRTVLRRYRRAFWYGATHMFGPYPQRHR